MSERRKLEIFSADCPICREAVEEVKGMSCTSCEITVHDTRDPAVAERAKALGIRSVPAVVIDGKPAGCCDGRGIDLDQIRRTCAASSP
jgi:glutaredoxin 3